PPGFGPEVKPSNPKSEIRNPKSESKNEAENATSAGDVRRSDFGFRISDFGFGRGPLFAVIPTLGIGGPLALLAAFFPSLCGGTLTVFRSWLALITVASLNSTLLLVYFWAGRGLEDPWLGSPSGLWLTMTLVTLAGTLWAWKRHHTAPPEEETEAR